MLPIDFYHQAALSLAPALLGCELVYGDRAGIIVETEAYRQDDAASHSFGGQTKRNAVMFGPGGFAYVYFTYGMHYCFNVVAGETGWAEAVLIRALEPTQGIAAMKRQRHTADRYNLCSGPAKLVQALGMGPEQNGASLTTPELHIRPRLSQPPITISPRIGIKRAATQPWRFFISNNPYVTKHKLNKPSA